MGDLQHIATEIVDNGASIPPLWAFSIVSVSGTGTLTGKYNDASGLQVGPLVSYSLPATPTTLLALDAAPFPSNSAGRIAIGFEGSCTTDVYVGTGATSGYYNAFGQPTTPVSISAATNANPVVCTTATPHGLTNQQTIAVIGATGNTAINTTAVATVTDNVTFSLPVAGNGAYTGGGVIAATISTGQNPAAGYLRIPAGTIFRLGRVPSVGSSVAGTGAAGSVTQGTSPWIVAGNAASGAADSGNPVKGGGVFNTTQPTVTNGQRVDTQSTARGATIVATGVDPLAATGNVASLATDSGNPVKIAGVYNTALPVATNGQRVDWQMDTNGRGIVYLGSLIAGEDITNNVLATIPKTIIASTYSPSSYQSAASGSQVVSANVKNSNTQVTWFRGTNVNASTRYLWITNATTAPASGTLLSSDASVLYVLAIPTGQAVERNYPTSGKNLGIGYSFGFSTSATTFTNATAADHTFNTDYF